MRKSPRAKHVRISVHRDGQVVVTLPRGANERQAERFVQQKMAWIVRAKARMASQAQKVWTLKGTRAEFLALKEQARTRIHERIAFFQSKLRFPVRSVAVRNQSTRWGSCSRAGRLNFHYKIILLPEALVDYIVVHELCHLYEHNHSDRFWNLVGTFISNYRELRKSLKHVG